MMLFSLPLFFLAILMVFLDPSEAAVIRVPDDYESLQTAIDSAAAGDTVLISPGRYQERITFRGRNITVASRYLLQRDVRFIRETIIDGNEEGRVVSFINGEGRACRLVGVTVTGGLTNYGGGIYIRGSSPTLERIVITGNEATNNGGGVYATAESSPLLNFVTIVNNSAQGNGGAVWTFGNSNLTITNSILYFNNPTNLQAQVLQVSFTDVQGGYEGEGNIDEDPLFVNRNGGDFLLRGDSPCIDAGDPNAPRDPDGSRADMGALFYTRVPIISVNPDGLDFGQVTLGHQEVAQVEVANIGQNLLIGEAPFIEPEDAPFRIGEGEEAYELQPGDNLFIQIVFEPQDTGLFEGNLILLTNDPEHQRVEVSLRGVGIPPYPRIELSTDELLFGGVPLRELRTETIWIYNRGEANLTLDTLYLEGNGEGWFNLPQERPHPIAPGDSDRIDVSCRPTGFGERSVTLHILTNDPRTPHLTIPIFSVGIAPPPHFRFVNNTGSNHSILVLSAMVDDDTLSFGSEIGVFDHEGNCYGASLWLRDRVGLVAWGDNIMTEEQDGFEEGDTLYFRFYDLENDTELVAEVELVEGDRVYQENGLSVVRLTATREEEGGGGEERVGFTLRMNSGWNLISSPAMPQVRDVRALWRPLVERGSLVIIKDGSGRFYAPSYGFSNMLPWDFRYGYLAKLTRNDTLFIEGPLADEETPIPCREGWNTIAYLPQASLTAQVAFANIRNQLEMVKDGSGRFYVPRLGFSNMLPLRQGLGYLAKVTQNLNLVWNVPRGMPEGQSTPEIMVRELHPAHYQFTPQSPYNMSLLISSALYPYDWKEIVVKGESGGVAGLISISEGPPWGVAVWERPSDEPSENGAEEGELLTLWAWDGVKETLMEVKWLEGDGRYHRDGLAVVSVSEPAIPPSFHLTITPNPFNNQTVVRFWSEERGDYQYEVIDIRGRVVMSNSYLKAEKGVNTLIIMGDHLSAGVYLLNLKTARGTLTAKMAVVK